MIQRIHPEDRTRVATAIRRACDSHTGGEYQAEFRLLLTGEELRWVSAKGKCFFQEQTNSSRKPFRFLGTLLDCTEHKLAHHALLQAEQLAATGRLAASIAHEINNPLEAITNLLYLLRDEGDESQRQAYLAQAESELARVSKISSNTLRFYRDPIGIADVHVPGLIQSVLSLFQGQIAMKGIELSLKLEKDMFVSTAQGELRQVLVNLVSNALDAMPQGGRLNVHCRTFRSQVGKRRKGFGLCIADTGHGMPPEVLRRIFEPFFTTKGAGGTGLGLWLSMSLLRKHGFALRVKSKPHRGTVFTVFMPQPVFQISEIPRS